MKSSLNYAMYWVDLGDCIGIKSYYIAKKPWRIRMKNWAIRTGSYSLSPAENPRFSNRRGFYTPYPYRRFRMAARLRNVNYTLNGPPYYAGVYSRF
jgi:hypothetical protein